MSSVSEFKVFIDEDEKQEIVDSMLIGYDNHVGTLREEKKENKGLIFDSMLKNARGQYIDSGVWRGDDNNKIRIIQSKKKKRAGRSYDYGEYMCQNKNGKFLFILKSKSSLDRVFKKSIGTESIKDKDDEPTEYFTKMLEINHRLIMTRETPIEGLFEKQVELFEEIERNNISLFSEEKYNVEEYEDIDFFFVIAYTQLPLDKGFSTIKVYFPNPVTGELKMAQDLTDYIKESKVETPNLNGTISNASDISAPLTAYSNISDFDDELEVIIENVPEK